MGWTCVDLLEEGRILSRLNVGGVPVVDDEEVLRGSGRVLHEAVIGEGGSRNDVARITVSSGACVPYRGPVSAAGSRHPGSRSDLAHQIV